jgi:hypothetical protein
VMLQLPMTGVDEDAATAAVAQWVQVVQDKMTASASREWLEATLCDFLRQGLIETLKVIEAADAGDEIADAALRRVYAEMSDVGEVPATLKAYGIKAVLRGPVTRSAGRNMWFDNWRRDIGIACLVCLTMVRFELRPTRNREQRRKRRPSASSVVAAALGKQARINVAEKRVENIWAGLQGQVATFLARQFENVPINSPELKVTTRR